ncbi:hypothetical protein L1887_17926 [Cichorium endivia]|nr:hypothetical protein L1887_17926 [Cichorium endivia]
MSGVLLFNFHALRHCGAYSIVMASLPVNGFLIMETFIFLILKQLDLSSGGVKLRGQGKVFCLALKYLTIGFLCAAVYPLVLL